MNKRVVKCPEEVASQLSVPLTARYSCLSAFVTLTMTRCRLRSRVPVELIHDPDAIGISLYDYFRSQNIFPQRTRSRVSARMPDSEFQAHISMDDKIPVLVIKRLRLTSSTGRLSTASATVARPASLCARSNASRVGAIPPRWLTTRPPRHFPASRHPPDAILPPDRQAYRPHGCRLRQWYRRRWRETQEHNPMRRLHTGCAIFVVTNSGAAP